MFNVSCGGAEILRVIKFVWTLLDIVLFIVPMGLIVMISLDLAKNVIAGKDDDMKKNLHLAMKRILYCVALFFVEPICGFAVGMLGDVAGVEWATCLNIARTESDFSQYEVEFDDSVINNDSSTSNASSNSSTSTTNSATNNNTMKTSKNISLNQTTKYLKYKKSFQLKATLKNISGNVTWTSSNSNVAKVDSNGKVTATGGGVAIITASVNGEATSCKVIAIRNSFKTLSAPWRTTATIYYDGNKKITYYFRRQNYRYACSSEKINGNQICTDGFKTWYANHGCATIATTAVVNAYQGKTKNNLMSSAKMRMVYEKNEYNWKSKYSSDYYCNKSGNLNQLTRDRVAAVLNNQFKLSATAYTIASTKGNEAHIERITNALAEGRPVIIFVNAKQAGTKKFTSGVHTLVMVGFADTDGHVLVLDSSHNGFKEDTVKKMVNQYIGRGTGKYKGYIVLNKKK